MLQTQQNPVGGLRAGIVQLGNPADNKRAGSLASAFERLNEEVSRLEGQIKAIFERVNPMLEPLSAGQSQAGPVPPTPANAPLANAVFEYSERVQRAREAIEEIVGRFAY